MSILKLNSVTFKGTEHKEIDKKQTEVEEQSVDENKSNAAKYMIGAATLAGVIAAGIIGHKQGWFRKAAKQGEDIINSAEQNSRKAAGRNGHASGRSETELVNGAPEAPKKQPETEKPSAPPEVQNQPDPKKIPEHPEVQNQPEPKKIPEQPKLEGKALIENNLQSLNSDVDKDKIIDILSGTVYEIGQLPKKERITYIDKYLESIKNVSAKFSGNIPEAEFEFRSRVFDFGYLMPGDNKIAAEKLVNFVKENPEWTNLVTSSMLYRTNDMFYGSRGTLKQEAIDIRKMFLNSDIKPKGIYDIGLYDLSDYDRYDDVSRDYIKTTLKLSLKTGMDEPNAKWMLEALWESPETYQKLLGINPLKIDSAVRKSYKELTGKMLDYHYENDSYAKWLKNDVKNKLSKKPYIDSDTVDFSLEPTMKEGAWSKVDMNKYYGEDLNIEKLFSELQGKQKVVFRDCICAIKKLPKDMQAEYYTKYFEELKKYTPEELGKIDCFCEAFDFSDINMAEKILKFGKENPQYSQIIASKIVRNIEDGVLNVDESIKLLKLLEKEKLDLSKCRGTIGVLTGLRDIPPNTSIIHLERNNCRVSVDKANEFRRAAFDLYLQMGVTSRVARRFASSNFTEDYSKLFGMTKDEFLNKINAAVKENA